MINNVEDIVLSPGLKVFNYDNFCFSVVVEQVTYVENQHMKII